MMTSKRSILSAVVLLAVVAFALLVASQSYADPVAPVELGTAGNFAILAETKISTTGTTSVVGDMGVSPIDSTAITGFNLILDGSGTFSTSSLVTGKVYAADYGTPTPTYLGTAIGDMGTAYTDAAGRAAGVNNLDGGNLAGVTLDNNVYQWGSAVTISGDVTLDGPADAVWIFQINGTLDVSAGKKILLSGGAQANNVFWQVTGATTLFASSEFQGTILDATGISMQDGATLYGRALAGTAVTLIGNTVVNPDAVVPEPCTILLLGCGLVGLFASRRRSRSAA